MKYHSTHSDLSLWYPILRGKQKKTRIVGFCTTSTECSAHIVYEKLQKIFFFQASVVFSALKLTTSNELQITITLLYT